MRISAQVVLFAFCLGTAGLSVAHPGAQETLDHFSQRIAATPESQTLYFQRGVAYSHAGQYDKALADLLHAADLGDPRAIAYELGVVHFQMKDYVAATRSFDSYLEYRVGDINALRYRARSSAAQGDTESALEDYNHIFAVPGQAGPTDYVAASTLMLESPEHGMDAAIGVLDLGMEDLGIVPQLQGMAIELALNSGRYDSAINRLKNVPPSVTRSPFWQVEMGQLLIAAGRNDLAYPHLEHAQLQLAQLRKTPARVQLMEELQNLLEEASHTRR